MRFSLASSRSRVAAAAVAVGMLIGTGAAAGPLPSSVDTPFTPIQTVYSQDFEDGDGGYTTGGVTTFQYGSPTSPPTPATGQGPMMWGTNLAGVYNNNECGYLQSAPIDLSAAPGAPATGASLARLLYRQWLHTENRYDAGIVLISTDGANFTRLEPVGGYNDVPLTTARACLGLGATDKAFTTATAPADDGWTTPQFDITPYMGATVTVRWMFASDFSVVRNGWYVDDVAVQLGVGGSVAIPDVTAPSIEFQPLLPVYTEDFEAGEGGWTTAGTATWELGSPVSPPDPRPGSLSMWGTHLLGDYLTNECASLTSPPIELPGVGDVPVVQLLRLSANVWRYTESRYDGAVLQISADDGATWLLVTPDKGGYDNTLLATTTRACLGVGTATPVWTGPATAPKADEYLAVGADITQFMGSTVRLRFVFASDGDTERRGVYVDDISILAGVGLAAAGVGDPTAPCGTFPGWTVAGTNASWCYGSPTTGPASTKPVYATNLGGNYNAGECSTLTSPAIDTRSVTGLSQLTLQFEHFMRTANTLDGGVVQVSDDDGTTWTTMTPVGGYNSTLGTDARTCVEPLSASRTGWSGTVTPNEYGLRQVRLGAYDGDTIRVRFIFGSSASSENLGWYIRAVGLTKGAAVVPLLP